MKLFLNLLILCCCIVIGLRVDGTGMKPLQKLTAQSLKRTTRKRNKIHNHEHNFHDALDRLMRTRIILHDESTYYDVILMIDSEIELRISNIREVCGASPIIVHNI